MSNLPERGKAHSRWLIGRCHFIFLLTWSFLIVVLKLLQKSIVSVARFLKELWSCWRWSLRLNRNRRIGCSCRLKSARTKLTVLSSHTPRHLRGALTAIPGSWYLIVIMWHSPVTIRDWQQDVLEVRRWCLKWWSSNGLCRWLDQKLRLSQCAPVSVAWLD